MRCRPDVARLMGRLIVHRMTLPCISHILNPHVHWDTSRITSYVMPVGRLSSH